MASATACVAAAGLIVVEADVVQGDDRHDRLVGVVHDVAAAATRGRAGHEQAAAQPGPATTAAGTLASDRRGILDRQILDGDDARIDEQSPMGIVVAVERRAGAVDGQRVGGGEVDGGEVGPFGERRAWGERDGVVRAAPAGRLRRDVDLLDDVAEIARGGHAGEARRHRRERHVLVARAARVADRQGDPVDDDDRTLRQAREGATDRTAGLVADDGVDVARDRLESAKRADAKRGAVERDRPARLHDGLVVSACARGLAADLLHIGRARRQIEARDRDLAGAVPRREGAAEIDRDRAGRAGAAQRRPGLDFDRGFGDRAVDLQRSRRDRRGARIGVDPREDDSAGVAQSIADDEARGVA
jgi:hypothetical protein